ncbi:unnamed protein product [Victoria cruziana]
MIPAAQHPRRLPSISSGAHQTSTLLAIAGLPRACTYAGRLLPFSLHHRAHAACRILVIQSCTRRSSSTVVHSGAPDSSLSCAIGSTSRTASAVASCLPDARRRHCAGRLPPRLLPLRSLLCEDEN